MDGAELVMIQTNDVQNFLQGHINDINSNQFQNRHQFQNDIIGDSSSSESKNKY